MTPQDAYDGLQKAKDIQATIRDTIKDSQESCKPLAAAQEEYETARDARKSELDQWKAENEPLLRKLDEAKAAVKEAKELLDEVALNAYTRGEEFALLDHDRPVAITFTTKLKVEKPEAAAAPLDEDVPAD